MARESKRRSLARGRFASAVERVEDRTLLAGVSVLAVPYLQAKPDVAHPVHEEGRITLKAVVRGADPTHQYQVQWDTDADGNFDEEFAFVRSVETPGSTTIYDIGQTYLVPYVSGDTNLDVGVRVRDTSTGEDSFGMFRLYVHDFRPSNDPRNWTSSQLDVIQSMTVQESMWYLHRQTTHAGSGSGISGVAGVNDATAVALDLMASNGHLPAYAPGTFNSYGRSLPAGWQSSNDARWSNDPYAETALRYLNHIAAGAEYVAVAAMDEGTASGYSPSGQELSAARIAGTADGRGLSMPVGSVNVDGGTVGKTGYGLAAIASTLEALAGTPVQVGPAAGQTWEWYAQQAVDYLGFAQIDSGPAAGSWDYYPITSGSLSFSNADSLIWAVRGLAEAETRGGRFGVIVTNLHKYRAANPLVFQQQPDGAASSRPGWGSDFNYTGGLIELARWLNADKFNLADYNTAFAGYSAYTRSRLRQAYDGYLNYTVSQWTSTSPGSYSWWDGLWGNGDYLQGNTNSLYNAGIRGEPYTMLLHANGYRRGQPDLRLVGSRDWNREFAIYLSRAQDRYASAADPLANYGVVGRVRTDLPYHAYSQAYGPPYWGTAVAGQVLTAEEGIFLPNYLGISGPETAEQRTAVTFEADPYGVIAGAAAYQWDFDPTNGFWWETGGAPDATGRTVSRSFPQVGTQTVTLRVTKNDGGVHVFTKQVTVTPDVTPPSVTATTPSLAGGAVAAGTGSLAVTFSEAVTGANIAANYILQSTGTDGLLGTDDDVVHAPSSVTVAGNTATLTFASHLPAGVYRLTVRDVIADAAGLKLDGNGDGTAGGDYVRDFVVAVTSTALSSPNGFVFDVDTDGSGTGQLVQGTSNAFDGLNRLSVGGTGYGPVVSGSSAKATEVGTTSHFLNPPAQAWTAVPGLQTTFTLNGPRLVRLAASLMAYSQQYAGDVMVRFVVDGQPTGAAGGYLGYTRLNPNEWLGLGGEDFVSLGTGTHTVRVEFWSQNPVYYAAHAGATLSVLEFADLPTTTLADGGRTIVTPSQVLSGLTVHREVTIPNAGSHDFARTVDVFENKTAAAITTTVRVAGNLGSDAGTVVFMTSDGDTLVEATDLWFATDDADPAGGTPAVVHLVHGPAGLKPRLVGVTGDNVEWEYDITVAAGQTLRLAHFTVVAGTRDAAVAAANALVTPSGFGGQAAAFLTPAELNSLANFQFNQAPSVTGSVESSTSEDSLGYVIDLLAGSSDPDVGDVLSVADLTFVSGDSAGVAVNGNALTVDPSAYNHLGAGQSAVIVFSYNIIDGRGGSVAQTVTVVITGTNDAAVLSSATVGLTETDAPLATGGQLTVSDVDSPAAFVAQAGTAGAYGTFAVAADGTWTYAAGSAHDAFVAGQTYTDTFTVRSADGTLTSVTVVVTGTNDRPVVAAVAPHSVSEHVPLTLGISASDVDGGTLTYSLGGDAPAGASIDAASGQVTWTPAEGQDGEHTFTVVVSDGSLSASRTVTVTVNEVNAGPTLALPSLPSSIDRGRLLSFTAVGSDPDTGPVAKNQLTYSLVGGPAGASIDPLTGAFRWRSLETGSFTFTVRVTDDGGLSADRAVTVAVNDAAAAFVEGGTLFVIGTQLDDKILVSPSASGPGLQVTLNGQVLLAASGAVGRVAAYGFEGSDDLQVAGSVATQAWLYGGAGNDRLKGGAGHDVLLGGDGADDLAGNSGRDLLIGGLGADRIVGNADEDVLVAGTTAYDGDESALSAIMAEWTRSDRTFAQRAAAINGLADDGLNGGIVLRATEGGLAAHAPTVSDDGAADVLTGSAGDDWFFFGSGDKATDLKDEAFADLADWLLENA